MSEAIPARLSEDNARVIATGRLRAARHVIHEEARKPISSLAGHKPAKLAKELLARAQAQYGPLLLWHGVKGHHFVMIFACPHDDGSACVLVSDINMRSGMETHGTMLNLTCHAVARLMQRRYNANTEQVLGEELPGLVVAVLKGARPEKGSKLTIQSAHGRFVVKTDDDGQRHVLTWTRRRD